MDKKFYLVDFRQKHGLTQAKLADLLGMNTRYISMVETGVKPFSSKMEIKLDKLEKKLNTKNEASLLEESPPCDCSPTPGNADARPSDDLALKNARLEGEVKALERILASERKLNLELQRKLDQAERKLAAIERIPSSSAETASAQSTGA